VNYLFEFVRFQLPGLVTSVNLPLPTILSSQSLAAQHFIRWSADMCSCQYPKNHAPQPSCPLQFRVVARCRNRNTFWPYPSGSCVFQVAYNEKQLVLHIDSVNFIVFGHYSTNQSNTNTVPSSLKCPQDQQTKIFFYGSPGKPGQFGCRIYSCNY
jgi:hypothetical protein